MQGWQQRIYNSVLESFVWSKYALDIDVYNFEN